MTSMTDKFLFDNTFSRGEGAPQGRMRNAGGNLAFSSLSQTFSALHCTPFLISQLR